MINTTSQKYLTKSELVQHYLSGSKKTQSIGIEFEKIGVINSTNKAVPYQIIEKLLEKLSEFENYKRIFNNDLQEHLIGLNSQVGNITLEPGSQFEFSANPQNDLKTLDLLIKTHNNLTKIIANDLGIKWLGCGIQPLSTFDTIKIIPKKRYEFMSEYLPQIAMMPLVMMRETAGIQVGIDYKDEQDAINKLRLSLKLTPIVSAVFANSPIREGKLTEYKSFRAKSWTQTDKERCGLISSKIFDKNYDFTFEDYINKICEIQMIFLNYKNTQVPVKNYTFNDFMKDGYNGEYPNIKDYIQHASLYFPDIRLKTYLEIRNHDSQKAEYIMCIPAFWKGIMYNRNAMEAIEEIIKPFNYFDFEQMRNETPMWGTDYKIKGIKISQIAKEIFNIAFCSLKQTNEEHYIEPILELIEDEITPADIIIKNFNGIWHQDINKYIEFSEI